MIGLMHLRRNKTRITFSDLQEMGQTVIAGFISRVSNLFDKNQLTKAFPWSKEWGVVNLACADESAHLAGKNNMTKIEKRSRMESLVRHWQSSGKTQAEYAREHGLKVATLRYWVSKFRKAPVAETSFVEISGGFMQHIHIRYPNGVELTLPFGTPAGLLRNLIGF